MIQSPLFNNAGTIHVTLPGHTRAGDHRYQYRPLSSQYSVPDHTQEEVGHQYIQLHDGSVVRVGDASNLAFARWYLRMLRKCFVTRKEYRSARRQIFEDLQVRDMDMLARWYLLEMLVHLDTFKEQSIQVFVEVEQQEKEGAA